MNRMLKAILAGASLVKNLKIEEYAEIIPVLRRQDANRNSRR